MEADARSEGKWISTVRLGPKSQIVIPKEVRDMFGLGPGDSLLLMADVERGIALGQKVLRGKAGLVDQSFGVGVNQDLDPREFSEQLVLDFIHHIMGSAHRHGRIDRDVELNEIAIARSPGAQVM